MWDRREFLAASFAMAGCARETAEEEPGTAPLIAGIETSVIWDGRATGFTWFQPRACRLPDGTLLMALQRITGSDNYGSSHLSVSTDVGRSWSEPQSIPGLERRMLPAAPDGSDVPTEEAVADVTPQYHPRTDTTLMIGWNVYYQDDALAIPNKLRWPVYVVRRADGTWTERKKLEWDDPIAARIYGTNCSQRWVLPDGKILIPVTYASYEREDRLVGTLLCSFDDETLTVERTGNGLELAVKRGLLEPSITEYGGTFYMTIRAEDGRGYWARSDDGLQWAPMESWRFDDGEELVMSTTQQHWMEHREALFLVYTRKTEENAEVMRWRAPLYCARFDEKTGRLLRDSEQVVLPMDVPGKPAARMGNFAIVHATENETLITVGEARPEQGWAGDTLQARVVWSRPNEV